MLGGVPSGGSRGGRSLRNGVVLALSVVAVVLIASAAAGVDSRAGWGLAGVGVGVLAYVYARMTR